GVNLPQRCRKSMRRALFLLALVACTERHVDSSPTGTVTSDSAGVALVHNLGPSSQGQILIGAEPRIIVDGHAAAFHSKWIESAVKLDDDRTVVLLGDPFMALLVGRDGKAIRRIGGTGGGPGEFRRASHLYANADGTIG